MSAPASVSPGLLELLDRAPAIAVLESEYRRLLGYPPGHVPEARALELAAEAGARYAEHGRPWFYLREVDLHLADGALRLDGVDFNSPRLRDHLLRTGAKRALILLASAGRACEERAARLWTEGKPDEYFFLEMYGSAVVEHLVATLSGRICALADAAGLVAVPHYSPGYTGWDVAEQVPLFGLIRDRMSQPLPEAVEVLDSGMLRPKKSLLAVVGLAPATGWVVHAHQTPCESCSFSPCQYRRSPYRHAAADSPAARPAATGLPVGGGSPGPDSRYTVSTRALQKWSTERVRLVPRQDGTVAASFRFDGTTCSNMGWPLAFEYSVTLGPPAGGSVILAADCRPAPGDEGHLQMCAYLNDPDALIAAISAEKPLLGRPLGEVLDWSRAQAPSGCYCSAESRTHKWGLALEAIHFTIAQVQAGAPSPRPPIYPVSLPT